MINVIQPPQTRNVFTPLDWQKAVWMDHSPVVLLTGSAGGGKALALDTPVLTMDGFKPMSDIEVGDTVFDMYGLPTQVVATTDVMYDRPCYILTLSSGEEIVCDAEHEWVVGISGKSGDDRLYVATTKWLADNDNRPAYIPLAGPVERTDSDLPVDPWLLGFLLGDGYMRVISFTTADEEIVGMVEAALPPDHGVSHYGGYQYGITTGDNRNNRQDAAAGRVYKNSGGKYTAMAGRVVSRGKDTQEKYVGSFDTIDDAWEAIYAHNGHREKRLAPLRGGLRYAIDELGLTECRSATKFVPDMYKYASHDQRLALLRGLMDADGYCQPERGRSEITVISRQLAEDIHEIACSLGIKSHLIFKWSSLNGVKYESWRVHFTSTVNPFSLERKARHIKPEVRKTQYRRYIESVEPVESVPVKCIQTEAGTYLITQSHIPTHNSRILYEIGHAFCMRYPGANVLALRKKYVDTKSSIVPTLDDIVIGIAQDKTVKKSTIDRHYLYQNRSRLWWGGMHSNSERESLRSIGSGGSLDLVLMEEGNQFTEDDFNELLGRLRGRAGPWTQIIIATNPDGPAHWINRRLIVGGEASVHISNVNDNIYMNEAYRKRLMSMTGEMKARLALGLWVEGSGLVIDTWRNAYNLGSGMDGGGNVSLAADYMYDGGRVVMTSDDGYTGEFDDKAKMFTQNSHPRVFLLAQIRPTGQICVFGESYEVKLRYKPHLDKLDRLLAINRWPKPSQVYYDKSSATLEGELREAGYDELYRSTSQKDESIKFLNERVGADENGFRHILVHPRCRNLILEMSSYAIIDGKPAKFFDHGCLVAGTIVETKDGPRKIESIRRGVKVLTRDGYFPVAEFARTGENVRVLTVILSDGRTLTGTPDHPIFVAGRGRTRLDALRYRDILIDIRDFKEQGKWTSIKKARRWLSSIAASSIGVTRKLNNGLTGLTTSREPLTEFAGATTYTEISGKTQWEISPPTTMRSITVMATRLITTLGISSAYRRKNTQKFRMISGMERTASSAKQPVSPLPNGIEAPRAANGIKNMGDRHGLVEGKTTSLVSIVESLLHLFSRRGQSSALTTARPQRERRAGLITRLGRAQCVVKNLLSTSILRFRRVPVYVERVSEAGTADVYNIAVGGGGPSEYFANGMLVSNCDALRYLCWGFYKGSGSSTIGIPDSDSERLIDAKMREIDKVMDRVDAKFARIQGL